ncbi:MAG TPA: glycoside hydrolase domain-containing protein [Kofleriaceae bacterium]|nr:glycoside hydrolase domain-containing protein [Kofleriaceae bacterium]
MGIKDWRSRSVRSAAIGLALAAGVTGLAGPGAPTAYAQAPGLQARPLEVRSMQLIADGVGWAADQSHVLWTRDNGQQWTDLTPPALGTDRIQRVVFRTQREGWILALSETGSELAVWRTQDGGASWTKHAAASLPDGGSPVAIDFADAANGWVMVQLPSSANFSPGLLLATRDGGQSWKPLATPPIGGAIHFTSRTSGWLAGGPAGDQLYVTRDGGQHWARQIVSPPSSVDRGSGAIYQLPRFRTETDGVLPILFAGPSASLLATYVTADAGATWRSKTLVALPAASDGDGHLAASVINADTVIVAPGQSTEVIAMADGAQRSLRRSGNLSPQQAIVDIDFQAADRGWLTLANGQCAAGKSQCRQEAKLFTTTDGGRTMHDITPMVTAPSSGVSPNVVFLSTGKGFDKCAIGTVSQMQSWWTSTPWSWANVYIGGVNRGCGQSGLTSSWVHSVFTQGWRLVPTWVGPQAPGSSCTGCSQMSTNTTTARQQGVNEANAAADELAALGFPAPSIVYYDMERYDPTTSAAVKAFIDGWVAQLRARGHQAGVYGAGVNAASDWASIADPPQAVWIAQWNNVDGVFGLSGLSDSLWANHQRIHQFQGAHNETWGGVTFNIDTDRADGPVADD